jgi:hypothetical protein
MASRMTALSDVRSILHPLSAAQDSNVGNSGNSSVMLNITGGHGSESNHSQFLSFSLSQ